MPLGNPNQGTPPSGLLATFQNAFFEGPDRASLPSSAACFEYQVRQQIGHFFYLVDRGRREIVVINSNRFSVVDRILLPDPTDLAMGPNLDFLAVSNQNAVQPPAHLKHGSPVQAPQARSAPQVLQPPEQSTTVSLHGTKEPTDGHGSPSTRVEGQTAPGSAQSARTVSTHRSVSG